MKNKHSRIKPSVKACPCGINGRCPLAHLKVALIGGLDRLETNYRAAFEELGAEFYFHKGKCAGYGSERLRSVINNADVAVFITSINSHNALLVSKELCCKTGKRFVAIKETGPKRVSHEFLNRVTASFK